jgi:hypothetical protein
VITQFSISQDLTVAHRDKFGRTTFGRKWTRQDESSREPAPLPITLPLEMSRSPGSIVIKDATGRSVCYLDFDVDESGAQQTKRFTQAEAQEIAQMITRLLTDVGDK